MERYEIEAFLTLAEELHFGRTAQRMRVTTARVSQTIMKLERRVGVPLFERTSRRVTLTPIGRRLDADLRPAYTQIQAGFAAAVAAGRGIEGAVRVGFVGAAAGQIVMRATELFGQRHPACEVSVREVQIGGAVQQVRDGDIDVLLGCFPIHHADLVMGPVLLSETRMLAMSSAHRLARKASVSIEDLAEDTVIQAPCSIADYWRDPDSQRRTPGGAIIEAGATAQTLQEVLALVGAGRGTFVVGEQVTRFYARPDVAYIPFHDAPPLDWGLIWSHTGATARVTAFGRAAQDVADDDRHYAGQESRRQPGGSGRGAREATAA